MKNIKDFIMLVQKVDSTILNELIDCIEDDKFNERLDKLELEFAKIPKT